MNDPTVQNLKCIEVRRGEMKEQAAEVAFNYSMLCTLVYTMGPRVTLLK